MATSADNAKIFATIIQPMMGKVLFHPSLIAASMADECKNTRWFYKETHDILAECTHYAIDPLESNYDSHSLDGDADDHQAEDEEEDSSSSSNSFVSHHETFPFVHRSDRPDAIFNQMNQSVKNSLLADLAPLSNIIIV